MNKGRFIWILVPLALVAAASILVRIYLNRPSNLIEASGTIETTEIDVSFQTAGKVE